MKKYIYSVFILIIINQNLYSQINVEKKDFILDTAYKYEIVNPCIYEILDTLSNNLNNCIFNFLSRDYFFNIDIYEGNKIRGQIYPYKSRHPYTYAVMDSYKNTERENKGFFYYKDRLVLARYRSNNMMQSETDMFFLRIDTVEIIKCQTSKEKLPDAGKWLEIVELNCLYDTISREITITDMHKCTGDRYYYYEVKEGDTWEILAKKFVTTVDNIRTLNGKYDEREVPEEGHPITVHYKIVNGVLEVKRERTRFDP